MALDGTNRPRAKGEALLKDPGPLLPSVITGRTKGVGCKKHGGVLCLGRVLVYLFSRIYRSRNGNGSSSLRFLLNL